MNTQEEFKSHKLPELPEVLKKFAADMHPNEASYLNKLAAFTAQQAKMPADIRMALLEDCPNLNERNLYTMILCFEAAFFDELKANQSDKKTCTNLFIEYCTIMALKRII